MLLPALSLVLAAAPFTLQSPSGQLTFQDGVASRPLSGDLRQAALGYALSRRVELGLPATSTLTVDRAFSTRFGGTVHLVQRVFGVVVQGGGVVVTLDLQGRVVRLSSSVKSWQRAVVGGPTSGEAALALAAREVEGALLKADGAPWGGFSRRAFVVGDEVHDGFLVYVPVLRNDAAWYVFVDAVAGQVLQVENRARQSTAADVYAVSPGGLGAGVGVTPVTRVALGHFPAGVDGGVLTGDQYRALNCCPTLGCDADAGAKRATGMFQTFQGPVSYDVAICDRLQRANNETNPSGDYVYTPVDPPTSTLPSASSAADSDAFAEVHAYFHVNEVYDFMRDLSQGPFAADGGFFPFTARDARRGKLPNVWVNAVDPDFNAAQPNAQGVYVSNTLSRTENALFLPLEAMDSFSVPEYALDADTLVIYQGDRVDFAYDAPVVWHEFGHGVVYSTSNWDTVVSLDARSANNESSALHEGVADVLAFMHGNDSRLGQYIGPRVDQPGSGQPSSLRDAANSHKCPEVLWGESHQDSMHFAGALWQARSTVFQGTDSGRTFDAAFYAALVSFPLDVDFARAAQIITSQVAAAFPGMADAKSRMEAIFDARGVTNCSKVVDLTGNTAPRPYYAISGGAGAGLQSVTMPGPYQMKISLPAGARSLTVGGNAFSFGGGGTRLELLAKGGAPVTFTRVGAAGLSNDADFKGTLLAASQTEVSLTLPVDVPCGSELYFTLATTSGRGRSVQNLTAQVTPQDSCPVDAGVPDAGPPPPVQLVLAPEQLGSTPQSCGCGAAPAGLAWAALGLLALVRSRRRR